MNGQLIAGTPIAVDYFRFSRNNNGSSRTLYFLTHAHSDHMVGLTHTWRYGFIYMSAVTARIVQHERKVQKKWLKVLEVGESKFLGSKTTNVSENIVVTPLDARHCAGSVMFLFQGSFGNILYTGDFRFCDPSMLKNDALSQCSVIHRLYLDNTFCEPACEFPTREVAAAEVIEQVEADPDRRVVIGITKLGKEELLVRLALHFKVPVVIDETTYKFYQVLGNIPNVFTTDFYGSRIHAVMQDAVRRRARDPRHDDELLIIPTGLNVGLSNNPPSATTKHVHKISKRIVNVPYSNHSTFKELVVFVASIRPREVIPIVNYGRHMISGWDVSIRTDMSVFDRFLDKRPVERLLSPRPTVMLDHVARPERVAARSWWTASSSRTSIAWKKRAVETSKGVQFIDTPDTSLSTNEENNALDQVVHFYESSEGSAVDVPFSDGITDIFTTNKDEVPEFQEEIVIECVDMNVNMEEVATVDMEDVQSDKVPTVDSSPQRDAGDKQQDVDMQLIEISTVDSSSQREDSDQQQNVDMQLNEVPAADDTSRSSKEKDNLQEEKILIVDDRSGGDVCDKQVPDSTSPGEEFVTQNGEVDQVEEVPIPGETFRDGDCDQREEDMEPDMLPILVMNVCSLTEKDFDRDEYADVNPEVLLNSIIQVDGNMNKQNDLTESPSLTPTGSPVPFLHRNSCGEKQGDEIKADMMVLDGDLQVNNKQNDEDRTESPTPILMSPTAAPLPVLNPDSRGDTDKQDDKVNSNMVDFLEIDTEQKRYEADLEKRELPIQAINLRDSYGLRAVYHRDNNQGNEVEPDINVLLNDAFQFEDKLADFEARIWKLLDRDVGEVESPIPKVVSPNTESVNLCKDLGANYCGDNKENEDNQMEAELMALDWNTEDNGKQINDDDLVAAAICNDLVAATCNDLVAATCNDLVAVTCNDLVATTCNDLTKLQASPIPVSPTSVDAITCQVEIPSQVLNDVPIFESTSSVPMEECVASFMNEVVIVDKELHFVYSSVTIDAPTTMAPPDQCSDNDDDGRSSRSESVATTTSTVSRRRKRSRSTKDIRDSWIKTAKLFHEKRLTNEIPLYLPKDSGQCVL